MPRHRFAPALIALGLMAGTGALVPVPTRAAEASDPAATSTEVVKPPKDSKDSKAAEAARQRHQQRLQYFGRYGDERLQQYVNDLGQRLVAKSDRPDLKFTFTVLDSDIVNAEADPGGYIYVYRGLLALVQSEAELAAVLGHEIGHVTARHTAKANAGAAASRIGATILGVLTGNAGLMSAADMAGGAVVMGYNRQQESEADELGAKFIGRAGYDPAATVDMLRMLWTQEQYQLQKAREEGRDLSELSAGIYASHPDTDKRVSDATKELGRSTAADTPESRLNREKYLSMIDGLAMGSSGAQGVVRGSRFYHAGMGITLAFPSGWKIDNRPAKLVATTPVNDQLVEVSAMGIPPNTTAKALLGRLMQGQASYNAESLDVSGLEGYRANLRSSTSPWGIKGPVALAVVYYNGLAYVFVGATKIPSQFNRFEPMFVSSVKTLRRLRDNEYAKAEPERLRLIKAGPDTRIEQLAQDQPDPKTAAERLRLLNGLYPDKQPAPGQILKIVE